MIFLHRNSLSYIVYVWTAVSLFWTVTATALKLPIYKTVQPATAKELTRTGSLIPGDYFNSWTRSHGNAMSNRYSVLRQINTSNVAKLEVAWIYRSESKANIQANPIFVNGMAIFPIPGNYIVAVDGVTGKEQWRFHTRGKPAIRGLVWWPGNKATDPRIYFPAGSNLYALSLEGKPVPEFGQGGVVGGKNMSLVAPVIANGTIIYPVIGYPVPGGGVVKGIDVASGEILWKTPLLEPLPEGDAGVVDTYGGGYPWSDKARDLADIIEFSPEAGVGIADTYGGGNPWSGVSVDEARGLAYVTTGNPKPDFIGTSRPGNNRHANSVVAIDVRNGNIVWSFQEIAHDIWDKDIASPPILTQIARGGGLVDVVVALTKHGNTIVLDRVSGKPIYPWRLKRAPRSDLRGEKTAAYQPAVELPEPFAKQTFGVQDLTNLGPGNFAFARDILEHANSGAFPTFSPGKDTIYFGLRGGAEWPGGVVDPATHILYVCSNDVPWRIQLINVTGLDQMSFPPSPQRKSYIKHCAVCHGPGLQGGGTNPALYGIEQRRSEEFITQIVRKGRRGMPGFSSLPTATTKDIVAYIQSVRPDLEQQKQTAEQKATPRYQYTGWRVFRDNEGYPANKPPWGWLNALDLSTGRMVWKVPLGTDKDLEARGMETVGTENLGGPILTGGELVFVAGTTDNLIRAFDKTTGKELWRHELPFMGSAPPMVYMANSREYLLVPATGGTLDKPVLGNVFVAFSLPPKG